MCAKKHHIVTGLTIYSCFAPVTMVHATITDNKLSTDIKSNHEINLNAKYHELQTDVLHPFFGS